MRANIYVDGFNLSCGLRKTPCKWLDLSALIQLTVPLHDLHRIRYFTAIVKARPSDPIQPVCQQTYLRALRTLPKLSITTGHFATNDIWMPRSDCLAFHQDTLADLAPCQFAETLKDRKGAFKKPVMW